ncbi:hypothetical protein [Clostridium weizhouense]|uniref:Uncharacterized protein n=1 Tax=Clostridium weizhouense TaxID=2859781 RepID=A0ABS7AQ94_9CLOT|nr:hypothetical protein [Clostridium weizhouense]MBW6410248.1 hypothetical protein [Clostridium weizhouense]
MNKENASYPPKIRTDYHPTSEKIESVSVDGSVSIDLPNPAVDNIVVNNIANAEFDYTQDLMSHEDLELNNNATEKNYIKYCNK